MNNTTSIRVPNKSPIKIVETPSAQTNENTSCFDKIKELKQKNPHNLTCSYLNINSIRNKFNNFVDMIDQNIDIMCLAETKLDSSFPSQNFLIPGYNLPYRLDVNSKSGGILVYIKETIPSKELKSIPVPKDLQIIPIEINLRKSKWLIIPIYKPPSTSDSYFIENMNKIIDYYSHKYENVLTLGDFNMEIPDKILESLLTSHNLYSLNKKPTCFKSPQGSCIDLLLTNKHRSFKYTNTFETGFSDHHLMIYTMFRMTFDKGDPIKIQYRSFKNFNEDNFTNDLYSNLAHITNYNCLEHSFVNTLNKHAPIKQKFLRSNNKPFINKAIKKAISTRSRLRNIANKTRNENDILKYKKQRNFVNSLNRKTQKLYFRNLDPKNITTSKSFYQTFKPYFSSKYSQFEKLILVEKDAIISDNLSVAEVMNHFFINITDTLDIKEWPTSAEIEAIQNPITRAILKYENHPSINMIKQHSIINDKFNFHHITPDEILYEVKKLNSSKGTSGDIPIRIIKNYLSTYIIPLTDCFNNSINDYTFPDLLKLADVTPVFKKDDKNEKGNYRPISVLKAFAKILERLLYKQLNNFIEHKFSPLICGFRKGHNTQHALIKLLEDWRAKLDNKETIGTILCDLSKAFDTLPHDLLLAKLNAYGIELNALKLISNYLTNRKQRCKVGSSFSTWSSILSGVPQGSVLGPLLFNIYINDLFFFIKESSTINFADDNTIYANGKNIQEVIYKLENDIQNALTWFSANKMVANPKKFQLMFLGTREKTKLCLDINGKTSLSTSSIILLGLTIDWKLTFNKHVKEICSNANNKAKALSRLRYKLDQTQKLCLYFCFIMSIFGYCPLIWMFCGKASNSSINRIQRKALRATYNDYTSNYQNLLKKGNHSTIHELNKQYLLIEVYKCLNNCNPSFLSNLFTSKNVPYNLRTSNLLTLPKPNTITYGLKSITYRGSMSWNNLPDQLKLCTSFQKFKKKLKSQKVITCTCHLCSF